MIYRVFVVVVFIGVIVGSILLGGQQRGSVSPITVDERAADLGYAARQAQLVETGADGHPLYTINAALINEPPGALNVEMQQVRMSFTDGSGNEWTGRADSGVASQDTGHVELSGNVQISGVLPDSRDDASITTDRLSVDTHAQTVQTRDPVTLTLSGREIKARGLSANLKDGVVHLESNVHGTYSP